MDAFRVFLFLSFDAMARIAMASNINFQSLLRPNVKSHL